MDTVKRRLGQYGAAWVLSFLVAFALTAIGRFFLGMELARLADMVLMASFAVLAGLVIASVVATVLQRNTVGAKILVVLLALLLVLPLLWAPVLAVITVAWMSGGVIEYSSVYAGFRINVSQLLYPLVSAVVSGAAIRFVWELFQVVASIIGAISSAIQVWNFFRKLMAPPPAAYAPPPEPELSEAPPPPAEA